MPEPRIQSRGAHLESMLAFSVALNLRRGRHATATYASLSQ